MTQDQIWTVALKVAGVLAVLGVPAIFAYWVKHQAQTTILQKALYQLAVMMQGFSSDVTSGMQAAINDAASDGVVTAAERAALVAKLVALVKSSATSRFLTTLGNLVGLQSGSAFETWLAGIAGEHIDAQLTAVSPVVSVPAATPGMIPAPGAAQKAASASTTLTNPINPGMVVTRP